MTECSDTQERFDSDVAKIYSDLCISLNQPDTVLVRVTLPNNAILSTNFKLLDTFLDVKRYILPALQPTIVSIQQIRCVVYDGYRQLEASDHTLLKQHWNKCPIQVLVNIEHHEDVENISHVPITISWQNAIHPEHGNILDTNVIMPKHVLGYRDKKNGKFYKNAMVQTLSKMAEFDSQNNSLAIQTTQTQDATTEVVVECSTQTQTLKILRKLNIVRELSKRHTFYSNPIDDRDKYARVIQRSVRLWMTRKKLENMLKYYYFLKQITHNEEKNLKNIIYAEHRRTVINL